MPTNDPEKELFPFALSPSAAPPASGVHHAQVRVPPPSQARIELPLSSHASRPDVEEIDESGEVEIAIDTPPPSRPATVLPPPQAVPVPRAKLQAPTVRIHDTAPRAERRGPNAIVVAAAAAVVAVGLAAIGAAVFLRASTPAPRTPAFVDDPVASAAPPPSAAPAPPPSAAPAPKPFDRDAARAALDALAPKLESCKLPRGKPVRAKITFAPSGEATAVQVLAPASGRPAACVASRLHDANVDAFDGPATSFVHTFAR